MTYYQFIQAVEMKVKEVVDPGVSVGLHTAEKMNGVTKQGIILSREGVNISPTIYLEQNYRKRPHPNVSERGLECRFFFFLSRFNFFYRFSEGRT